MIKDLPLIKWPGGKRALIKHILGLLPATLDRYYEPFMGGGAVFFAAQPAHAFLSDNNSELMNCYCQVRDHPSEVIAELAKLSNSEDSYYRIRSTVPSDSVARAARLIYLTTLSFNGIHRENLKGEFNVPYGRKTHISPCDPQKIRSASTALRMAALRCQDFELAVSDARKGDVIYMDPPYTVAHRNNGFVKYNSKIFSWEDQIRLAEVAKDLAERACTVVVSNADHEAVRALYDGFASLTVRRASVIAASSQHRRFVTERLFYCAR